MEKRPAVVVRPPPLPRRPLSAKTPSDKATPRRPLAIRKLACGSAPENGPEARNVLIIMAEYGGKVIQLDMVDIAVEVYTWTALKSKVLCVCVCVCVCVCFSHKKEVTHTVGTLLWRIG